MDCIAVVAANGAIGRDNQLLFSLPEDMKHFRALTLGKTVIMGRKTLDSFPGGKPLPKRQNLVLTRDVNFCREGVTVCHSVEEVLKQVQDLPEDSVMVVGGAETYRLFLPYCRQIYLTQVQAAVPEADCFFPEISPETGWKLTEKTEEREQNGLRYTFCTYRRIGPAAEFHFSF